MMMYGSEQLGKDLICKYCKGSMGQSSTVLWGCWQIKESEIADPKETVWVVIDEWSREYKWILRSIDSSHKPNESMWWEAINSDVSWEMVAIEESRDLEVLKIEELQAR